jgi:hypothetical protein
MDIEGGFDQTDSRGIHKVKMPSAYAHRAIVEASKKKQG